MDRAGTGANFRDRFWPKRNDVAGIPGVGTRAPAGVRWGGGEGGAVYGRVSDIFMGESM